MTKGLFILLTLLLMAGYAGFSQPPVPPNAKLLYQQLNKSRPDTNRVNLLIKICRYDNAHSAQQPALLDSALIVANRAKALAERLSYPEGIGLSLQVMGQAWCNKKDFKRSDALIKSAIAIFLKNSFYRDAAEAYLNMEEFYLAGGGKDYQVMIAYYEQALPLFEKSKAILRAAATLNVLGDFYLQLSDFNKSITCLNKALTYYQQAGYTQLQGTYNLLGSAYLSLNQPKNALKYQLLAVKAVELVGDTSMDACAIYNHVGLVYYANTDYHLSNYYFKKALSIAESYHNPAATFLSTNIASSFIAQNMPDSAIAVLKAIEKMFPDISPEQQIKNNINYLIAYIKKKKIEPATIYYKRVIKVYDAKGANLSLNATILDAMIQYFVYAGQYDMAYKYMPIFKETTDKLPFKMRFRQRIYSYSYAIDSARHQYYSALQNYRQYAALKDSILEVLRNKQMRQLQVEYETEKKEKENLSLKKESLLQAGRLKQADHVRDLTSVGIACLLIIVIILYWSYRVKQKTSRAISEKNDSLNQLIIEKEWLLKEIHHRVKNNLQIVTGLLQRQSAYIDNDEALAAIQNSENRMHAIALIHQKLYQSESLNQISMPEYIDEMISYLKDSCALDNRIIFEKHLEEMSLDVGQAVPLGLILNEAITNAIKYAYKADENGIIYITLVKNNNQCNQLTIADDGPGLPPGFNIDQVDSLGINLMRGLCKQLGGSLELSNEQGCTINIIFKTETFSKTVSRE